ncbi:MAG: serine/threonine protein kinase [Calditrichaeota bacterium]|nr:serine/threonine protein kinase [Calditrichota bacterium]
MQNEDKIGSYKILDKIGEGGMADIFKALQPALKRNVVIKKLKDPNREIVARFKKEALISASFTQENVLAIYDFIYSNRSYYLVMEYVDGEDLRTIIDHMSPLPVHIAVLVILEIARGLEYTHNQNIIHRDIKPSNILISHEGNVKLIDFGVAKDDTNTQLTVTGLIVGTPSYMSPEQAHGDALSPQSDLYALGILLYEMLTGLKPFYGSNNTEILAKIVRSKYTPAHRINPEISFRLRRVMRKMLKKERHKRYKNAAALIHDLEKCIPWQIRSKKKEIILRFLDKLDKNTLTPSEDTIKAAMLEKSSSWGWHALRYSLAAALLSCGYAIFVNFSKMELGYIQLKNPVAQMELNIDGKHHRVVQKNQIFLGPYLQGAHVVEANDPINNSTYISRILLKANDTTRVNVLLPANPASAQIVIKAVPSGASILVDGNPLHGDSGELNISAGWHTFEIRQPGYQTYSEKRFLRAAESYTLNYTLSRL